MLSTIFVVVLILWLLGLGLHVAGGLIHLLLAVALVVLVVKLAGSARCCVGPSTELSRIQNEKAVPASLSLFLRQMCGTGGSGLNRNS